VFPGFLGPNKALLILKHEDSDIDHEGAPEYYRHGNISAGTVRYSIYPRADVGGFVVRSTDFEMGAVKYRQEYSAVDVDQYDYYAATSFRQLLHGKLDVSANCTIYEEDKRHSVPERAHKQSRVSLVPLWRVVDSESSPDARRMYSPVRFVGLYGKFDVTEALEGPSDFESHGYGVGISSKLAYASPLRTSFLLSAEGHYRDYHELDESQTEFNLAVKMGF